MLVGEQILPIGKKKPIIAVRIPSKDLSDEHGFDVVARPGIVKGTVDVAYAVALAQGTDGVVKLGVITEELQVFADVHHGILGRSNEVESLEGDHLGLDLNAATVAVLTGNVVHAAVAKDIHALRHG